MSKVSMDDKLNPENIEVYVRRHPNDWQTATYNLSDVSGLHWSYVSGGVGRRTSHETLFGYVMCDGAAAILVFAPGVQSGLAGAAMAFPIALLQYTAWQKGRREKTKAGSAAE